MDYSAITNKYVREYFTPDPVSKKWVESLPTVELEADTSNFDRTPFEEALKRGIVETPAGSYNTTGYGHRNSSSLFGKEQEVLINAKSDKHILSNGKHTENNIALYEQNMNARAGDHIIANSVYVDNNLVAFHTVNGGIQTPYVTLGSNAAFKAQSILDKSDGEFSTFVGKLKDFYGDRVSVNTFAEGEGPDYAQAHLMFNGTTFEDFIGKQTHGMNIIKQGEEQLQDYNARLLAFKGDERPPFMWGFQSPDSPSYKTTTQDLLDTYTDISGDK